MALLDQYHHLLLLNVVLVTLILSCHETKAQSGCTSVLISLSPCLNYVTGRSSTPSSSCCSQLANVVQSQPLCLCSALNGGGSSLGITVNQTQALALPSACNIQTPPISRCNGANGSTGITMAPASSPTGSSTPPSVSSDDVPASSPPETSMPDIPSGTGSKTTPTTQGSATSGSNNIKKPHDHIYLNFFELFIVLVYASTDLGVGAFI